MKHGIYLPTFGEFAEPSVLCEFASAAEAASWDGVFLWDHMAMWWDRAVPVADSWVALAAIAAVTERVRIGALVTPPARRRPWKLARETVTVDRLSRGRLVVGVGLGANPHEFDAFGEPADLAVRASMVDEALEVLAGLWSGEPISFHGSYYSVDAHFLPRPVQQPRIPVWVAGSWPRRAPFRRAARWDGAICTLLEPGPFNIPLLAIEEITELVAAERGGVEGFDVVVVDGNPEWNTPAVRAEVAEYAAAGVTWWVEEIDPWRFGGTAESPWPLQAMMERVRAGPPRAQSS